MLILEEKGKKKSNHEVKGLCQRSFRRHDVIYLFDIIDRSYPNEPK